VGANRAWRHDGGPEEYRHAASGRPVYIGWPFLVIGGPQVMRGSSVVVYIRYHRKSHV
jgi:hypothetical protein